MIAKQGLAFIITAGAAYHVVSILVFPNLRVPELVGSIPSGAVSTGFGGILKMDAILTVCNALCLLN